MKILRESPKLSLSVIVTLILSIYAIVSENSELLGIDTKTMAIISVIVSIVSAIWKVVSPKESVFKKASLIAHVGTRPLDPPKKP